MFRPLTITAVLNGWVVQCGCQTLVFQDRNQLTSELDAYLKDPQATEARFLKTAVNKEHTGIGTPAMATEVAQPMGGDRWSDRDREARIGQARQRDEQANQAAAPPPFTYTTAGGPAASGGSVPYPMTPPHGVRIRD